MLSNLDVVSGVRRWCLPERWQRAQMWRRPWRRRLCGKSVVLVAASAVLGCRLQSFGLAVPTGVNPGCPPDRQNTNQFRCWR